MLEKYIELLRPKIEEMFKYESSGHDISHLERVMKNSLYLQKNEGGNLLVIGVASFLHDIHRLKQAETGKYCSPKNSLPIIKEMLLEVDFPKNLIPRVLNAIEHHETYNWNNDDIKTDEIEALILQDADNLDGLGAIGIGRTFAFAGAYKTPLYDPSVPLNDRLIKAENANDISVIHYFYEMNLKLENHMNTKTAKELAHKKPEIMKNFIDELIDEWEGNYNS